MFTPYLDVEKKLKLMKDVLAHESDNLANEGKNIEDLRVLIIIHLRKKSFKKTSPAKILKVSLSNNLDINIKCFQRRNLLTRLIKVVFLIPNK